MLYLGALPPAKLEPSHTEAHSTPYRTSHAPPSPLKGACSTSQSLTMSMARHPPLQHPRASHGPAPNAAPVTQRLTESPITRQTFVLFGAGGAGRQIRWARGACRTGAAVLPWASIVAINVTTCSARWAIIPVASSTIFKASLRAQLQAQGVRHSVAARRQPRRGVTRRVRSRRRPRARAS